MLDVAYAENEDIAMFVYAIQGITESEMDDMRKTFGSRLHWIVMDRTDPFDDLAGDCWQWCHEENEQMPAAARALCDT